MNVGGRWDGRQLATVTDNTQRIANGGTDPKRWQRHTSNAAISVTSRPILEH